MLEVTGGLAVEFLHMLHSKLLQQLRKNDSSDRIDTVNGYAETGFLMASTSTKSSASTLSICF